MHIVSISNHTSRLLATLLDIHMAIRYQGCTVISTDGGFRFHMPVLTSFNNFRKFPSNCTEVKFQTLSSKFQN